MCGMLHRPSIRERYSRRPTCLMNVGEVIVGDDAKAVGRAAAKEPLSVYQRVWPIFGCGVSAASVVADREATEAERARLTTRCNRCNISTSVHGRRSWNRRASAESLETQVKVRGRCGSCLSGALESVRDRGSSLFRGACGDDSARWRSVLERDCPVRATRRSLEVLDHGHNAFSRAASQAGCRCTADRVVMRPPDGKLVGS